MEPCFPLDFRNPMGQWLLCISHFPRCEKEWLQQLSCPCSNIGCWQGITGLSRLKVLTLKGTAFKQSTQGAILEEPFFAPRSDWYDEIPDFRISSYFLLTLYTVCRHVPFFIPKIVCFSASLSFLQEVCLFWGTWVAQLVKCLTSAQVMISLFVSWSPV